MVRRLPRICSNSERWISPPSMRATTAPCLAVPGSYWKLNPRTTIEKNRSRCPNMEAGVCPKSESAIFSTGATKVVENCGLLQHLARGSGQLRLDLLQQPALGEEIGDQAVDGAEAAPGVSAHARSRAGSGS